ncbi:MAG: chorismate-binding protein [Candidatus Carbobacillus altaicus]|nr:chorismate-binding protein [Candidatus Carbobacillus altaicus]
MSSDVGRKLILYPLAEEIVFDHLTPISVMYALKERRPTLLESVENGSVWARYSYLAFDPILTWKSTESGAALKEDLAAWLTRWHVEPLDTSYGLTSPLIGGAIGAMAFEGATGGASGKKPTAHFFLPRYLLIFDHGKQRLWLLTYLVREEASSPRPEDADLRAARRALQALRETILKSPPPPALTISGQLFAEESRVYDPYRNVCANMTHDAFISAVSSIKDAIARGEVEQVVLSQRFSLELHADVLTVYRYLRALNPSPYMYILDLDEDIYVGSSPEVLLKVTAGQMVTRPIAGTRPRGKTEEEDAARIAELLADPKEQSEHDQLLALARSDFGAVAKPGSVRVGEYMALEKYSHVIHLVSHVEGELDASHTSLDALFHLFPAGTVSGAPREKAFEYIKRYETDPRGVYGGAIGWISPGGDLDLAIAIRTIHIERSGDSHENLTPPLRAHVQAGAGIVGASRPETEYEETRNKARALLVAMRLAEKEGEQCVHI